MFFTRNELSYKKQVTIFNVSLDSASFPGLSTVTRVFFCGTDEHEQTGLLPALGKIFWPDPTINLRLQNMQHKVKE
jgi:hypothetical protein